MGSYISIVNNTQDDWMCKLTYDPVALKIGILIGVVVAAIAISIATAGTTTPLVTAGVGVTATAVLGVSARVLTTIGSTIGAVEGSVHIMQFASQFTSQLSTGVVDQLIREGFQLMPAGSKQSWQRSLSLWQQGTCIQITVMDERTVMTRTLYMRPIFSGPTIDSNRDHEIQWWINKDGTKNEIVFADTSTIVPPGATIFGNTSAANAKPKSCLVPFEMDIPKPLGPANTNNTNNTNNATVATVAAVGA